MMLKEFRKKIDTESYGLTLSVLLTLAVCLQMLIVVATIFSFVPIKLDSSLDGVLPQVIALFRPEREMAFYQLFVIATVAVQIAIVIIFRERLRDERFLKQLGIFLLIEYTWIVFLLFAAFKIIIYKEPFWAKAVFFVILTASMVSKVFWVEIRTWSKKIYLLLVRLSTKPRIILACDVFFIAAVIMLLWIPNMKAALGRILMHDRFHDFDTFLMSPILAYLNGEVLNIDIFSPLGTVAPVFIGRLTQLLGGFTYEHTLQGLVILSIIYCIFLFKFLRATFGSVAIAMFGALLFIKLHFFHVSAAPLIWALPQHTIIKVLFDLPLFYFLRKHSRERNGTQLVYAAAACGLSLAYMPDTGLYQTLAFYGYLLVASIIPQGDDRLFVFPRDIRKLFFNCLLPWIVAGIILAVFQGRSVFSSEFLTNSTEFMNSFWQGIGNIPLQESIKARQFFALFMGLSIPIFFVLSAMVITFGVYQKQVRVNNIWAVAVCFYGLAAHWSYVNRSEAASYYVYAMPLVLIVCFWINQSLKLLACNYRRKTLLVLLLTVSLALLSNNFFIQYPNVLNISGHDWKEEQELLATQTSLDKDVVLVRDLSKSEKRVAVISSYSTRLLMNASRGPLLYYSPVLVSTVLTANEFHGTSLFSTDRMKKTINELEQKKPSIVFVEKKIFTAQLPKEYEGYMQSWLRLKNYLDEHYDANGEGQYLLVLKRKL